MVRSEHFLSAESHISMKVKCAVVCEVGNSLQKELFEERTISYVIEWCETPSSRVPGIVYKDTAVLYDVEGRNVVHSHLQRSLDLYLCIPHPLLDPVLAEASQDLQRFYSQTFWANLKVFRCCQAPVLMHIFEIDARRLIFHVVFSLKSALYLSLVPGRRFLSEQTRDSGRPSRRTLLVLANRMFLQHCTAVRAWSVCCWRLRLGSFRKCILI